MRRKLLQAVLLSFGLALACADAFAGFGSNNQASPPPSKSGGNQSSPSPTRGTSAQNAPAPQRSSGYDADAARAQERAESAKRAQAAKDEQARKDREKARPAPAPYRSDSSVDHHDNDRRDVTITHEHIYTPSYTPGYNPPIIINPGYNQGYSQGYNPPAVIYNDSLAPPVYVRRHSYGGWWCFITPIFILSIGFVIWFFAIRDADK